MPPVKVTRFRNPPLAEVIVELRWESFPEGVPGAPAPVVIALTAQDEQLFAGFAAQAGAAKGEPVVMERLLPKGLPVPRHQVCCRYSIRNKSNEFLYQLGPGVFTANAKASSYQSWSDFAPVVREGIEWLLQATPEPARTHPFTSVKLWYIDLFTKKRFFENESAAEFLQSTLRVNLQMPEVVLRQTGKRGPSSVALVYQAPLADLPNGVLEMHFQEGRVGADADGPGLLMHTAVSIGGETARDADGLMDALDKAHAIIHSCFLEMTHSLHDEMGPTQGD